MKNYEGVWSQVLPDRTPVIIRVDGRAFHTATRPYDKPWDNRICAAMRDTAFKLLNDAQNASVVYTQSDEISILRINYANPETQSWFGNKVQKIVSIAASIATEKFNNEIHESDPLISSSREFVFDARVFSLPRDEVRKYFIWRQKDCIRNSVSALARVHFSHKELQGKPVTEMLKMLSSQGIYWDTCLSHQRLGTVFTKDSEGLVTMHSPTPNFVENKTFFEPFVNVDKVVPEEEFSAP